MITRLFKLRPLLIFFLGIFIYSPDAFSENMHSVSILTGVLKLHKKIVIGEIHGTSEIPQLVGQSVSFWSKSSPVLVGLECSVKVQKALDVFLNNKTSLEIFRNSGFWTRPHQDGRSSVAMLDLLINIRELRRQGRQIDVFCLDDPGSRDIENGMYKIVKSNTASHHGWHTLIYVGNYHASILNKQSLGERLSRDGFYILFVSANSGTAWQCTEGDHCGVVSHQGEKSTSEAEIFYKTDNGSNATLMLNQVTSSPPAINEDPEPRKSRPR